MKQLLAILFVANLALGQPVHAINRSHGSKDTVVIEVGQSSKMMIITQTMQDLKDLQALDINQMLSDLNAGLDSAGANLETLSITDQSGDRFLKDSVKQEQLTQSPQTSAPLQYYRDENSTVHSDYTRAYREVHSKRRYSEDRSYRHWGDRTDSGFEFQIGLSNWLEEDNFPDDDAPYLVRPWGSWFFGLGVNSKTQLLGPLVLNWALNVSWHGWKMENNNVIINKDVDAGQVTFVENPAFDAVKSKLNAAYLNMSMVPMLDFSYGRYKKYGTFKKYGRKGFRVGAGPYVGYRLDSWTKFEYKENGDKKEDKAKSNLYLNNLKYGIRGQIGFKGMDFFMNYDLNTVFAKDRGPELQAVSFGIIL
jgi:hypothetical protein